MKNLFASIVVCLLVLNTYAQDKIRIQQDLSLSQVQSDYHLSDSVLFNVVKMWVVETYNNPEYVTVGSVYPNLIKLKGSFKYRATSFYDPDYYHYTITIKIKNGIVEFIPYCIKNTQSMGYCYKKDGTKRSLNWCNGCFNEIEGYFNRLWTSLDIELLEAFLDNKNY